MFAGESEFAGLVRRELARARERHAPVASRHEAYAVILEEVEEFWEEVREKAPDRRALLEELGHVAAMCQRAAEDLGLAEHLAG